MMRFTGKRLLVVLISLAMIITTMPTSTFAGNNVCKIDDTEYDTVQHAVDAASVGQTVKMIADSFENVTVAVGDNITLDLNGYTLSAPQAGGTVITNNGTLTITDSGTSGTITCGETTASGETNGGGIRNNSGATLTLSGGTISGNTVTASNSNSACGGGVYNAGIFTMTGGTITGNRVCGQTNSEADNLGGGVYNSAGATFTMNDGKISENIATGEGANGEEYCYGFGGGVCTDGTFVMNGGMITSNTCDQNGGGILVSRGTGASDGGTLTVNDGTISRNTAAWGAGITVDDAKSASINGGTINNNTASYGGGAMCIRNGETSITGGTFEENTAILGGGIYAFTGFMLDNTLNLNADKDTQGKASNIYLATGALIAIGDRFWGECGVSKSGTTGEITRATYSDYAGCFTSDNENYCIRFNNNNRLEILEFTVTVKLTEHGTVNADKTSSAVGEVVTLTNNHDEGYVFKGYTVTNETTKETVKVAADGTFTMPAADVSVTGKFAISQPVTITYVAPQNGSVEINGSVQNSTTVQAGDAVTLEAVPGSGYVLESYRVYKTGEEGTTVAVTNGTFTMPDYGVTVTANFKEASYVAKVKDKYGYTNDFDNISNAWSYAQKNSPATVTLLADVTTTGLSYKDKDITLDLNGYVLALEDDAEASVITNNGGTLTITDSNPNTVHYFMYENEAAWSYIAEPEEEQIAGAVAFADMSSATLVSDETVIAVSGGCITGGTGTEVIGSDSGGGICNRGKLTLVGGTICGNSAETGGGVFSGTGAESITMTGGTICGNYGTSVNGSGIHVDSYGSFTMTGGSVIYNVGSEGSGETGIYLFSEDNTFGGKAVVSNNGDIGEGNNNVYINSDDNFITIDKLESGAHIGITLDYDIGQFTTNGSADDVQYFFSDNPYYAVQYNGDNEGYLELISDVCKIERTGTQYETIAGALDEAQDGDTITLIANVLEDVTIEPGKSVTIDLNGKTLCAESDVAITNNGTLTLTDTGTTAGKITGSAKGVVQNGTLTVAGKLTIAGNTQNLYLREGKTVAVADGFAGYIGVTTEEYLTAGGFVTITGTGSADYSSYFTSDDGYLIINGENNTVKLHMHGGWSYTLSTDNKTITAGCGGSSECKSTDTVSLTISEPIGVTNGRIDYDGYEHPATLSGQEAWVAAGINMSGIQYEKRNGEGAWEAITGEPTEGGTYRACLTAGTGSDDQTAYVKYTIVDSSIADTLKAVESATYSASLTLSKNIDINLYIKKLGTDGNGAGFTERKLEITVNGTAVDSEDITYDETNNKISCVLKEVSPQDMGTDYSIVVSYDGVQAKSFTYSVKKYCEAVFTAYGSSNKDSTEGKLYALCEALLNYGKYAADYVNKDTASTVNTDHTKDFSEYSFGDITSSAVNGTAGDAALELGSTITLKYYVKTDKTLTNINAATQNVYILNGSGQQIDPKRVTVEKYTKDETYNYIVSVDLYASQLSTSYTLKLKGVSTDDFCITYGVYNYCNDAQKYDVTEYPAFTDTLKTLCKAIHNYGQAVQTYIESLTK